MRILNFEIKEKLDLYFDVKFDEEFEFDGLEVEKLADRHLRTCQLYLVN